MRNILLSLVILLGTGSVSGSLLAQEGKMVVATKEAPPFVIKNEKGEFEGISITLFEEIAKARNLQFEYAETELSDMISGLESGKYDASIAALTVNADRETRIDFTHPYYTTGLAIAVPKDESRLMAAISGFFSWKFFVALGGLCLLLLAVGLVVWLAERKGNKEQFGGGTAKGIGAGFWWAAVTMTTVGYGDKSPVTLGGRIVGFIWMFAAIIIISSFTAAIATSLTVSQLQTKVQGVDDLPGVKVLTLANSASASFLDNRNIDYKAVETVNDGLVALQKGNADALVYDKPILSYRINQNFSEEVTVLPDVIDRQDYSIGLPEGSKMREDFNTSLLRIINTQEWQQSVDDYLGER